MPGRYAFKAISPDTFRVVEFEIAVPKEIKTRRFLPSPRKRILHGLELVGKVIALPFILIFYIITYPFYLIYKNVFARKPAKTVSPSKPAEQVMKVPAEIVVNTTRWKNPQKPPEGVVFVVSELKGTAVHFDKCEVAWYPEGLEKGKKEFTLNFSPQGRKFVVPNVSQQEIFISLERLVNQVEFSKGIFVRLYGVDKLGNRQMIFGYFSEDELEKEEQGKMRRYIKLAAVFLSILIIVVATFYYFKTRSTESSVDSSKKKFVKYVNLCSQSINNGLYEPAIEHCDKALEVRSDDVGVLNLKGNAFYRLNKYEEAVEYYDKALRIAPEDSVLLGNKCDVLQKLGKHQEAIKYCDKALSLNPSDDRAQALKNASLAELNSLGLQQASPSGGSVWTANKEEFISACIENGGTREGCAKRLCLLMVDSSVDPECNKPAVMESKFIQSTNQNGPPANQEQFMKYCLANGMSHEQCFSSFCWYINDPFSLSGCREAIVKSREGRLQACESVLLIGEPKKYSKAEARAECIRRRCELDIEKDSVFCSAVKY